MLPVCHLLEEFAMDQKNLRSRRILTLLLLCVAMLLTNIPLSVQSGLA